MSRAKAKRKSPKPPKPSPESAQTSETPDTEAPIGVDAKPNAKGTKPLPAPSEFAKRLGEMFDESEKKPLIAWRSRSDRITPEKKAIFIEGLAAGLTPGPAARNAGFSRENAYYQRKIDKAFERAWDAALQQGYDGMEVACHQRALKGSDLLLIFSLKARRRDVWADKLDTAAIGRTFASIVGTVMNSLESESGKVEHTLTNGHATNGHAVNGHGEA